MFATHQYFPFHGCALYGRRNFLQCCFVLKRISDPIECGTSLILTPVFLLPVLSVFSHPQNILSPLVYFSLITSIFSFWSIKNSSLCSASIAHSRCITLYRHWTMAICSLLRSFQKQALANCHVFIFLNTPTGIPPWLTHTESQRPWVVVYSPQLDNPARGFQQEPGLDKPRGGAHVICRS